MARRRPLLHEILAYELGYKSDWLDNRLRLNNHPSAVQDGFALLGARLAYHPPSDRWEVALFGTNLTDERYSENGIFIFGFGPTLVVAGRPREWGVSTRFRF